MQIKNYQQELYLNTIPKYQYLLASTSNELIIADLSTNKMATISKIEEETKDEDYGRIIYWKKLRN